MSQQQQHVPTPLSDKERKAKEQKLNHVENVGIFGSWVLGLWRKCLHVCLETESKVETQFTNAIHKRKVQQRWDLDVSRWKFSHSHFVSGGSHDSQDRSICRKIPSERGESSRRRLETPTILRRRRRLALLAEHGGEGCSYSRQVGLASRSEHL